MFEDQIQAAEKMGPAGENEGTTNQWFVEIRLKFCHNICVFLINSNLLLSYFEYITVQAVCDNFYNNTMI